MMKKMKNKIFILAASILAASCSVLGPYKPVQNVSDKLYGKVPQDSISNFGTFKWQEVFTDQKLTALIDSALAGNLDLRITQEHVIQAEGRLIAAKLAYTPSLNLSGDFGMAFRGQNLSDKTYNYTVPAAAGWQLTPFRLTNNLKGAKADREQAKDYRQAVRSRLIASVANTYYTLLMLDEQLKTSKSLLAAWKKSLETVIALKDAGLADQVAVNQYQANYEKIRQTVSDIRRQIHETENAMALLLGKESGLVIKRGSLSQQKLPKKWSAGVPVQILTLRPDVRAAQRDLEMAHYATRGALLNYFPALSINGSFGLINPISGALSPLDLLANVSAGLVAPIFNSGKNLAAYKSAQSKQRETKLVFDRTLLEAGAEVNNAFGNLKNCKEKENYYKIQVSALDKAREDTEYLMKNSLDKTYLDVLFANTNYFDARLAQIANQAQKLQAIVSIYSALGGGSIE